MSLPKRKKFDNEIINPNSLIGKYDEYSIERIEKLLYQTDEKTVFLPRTIGFGDIDMSCFEFVNNKIELIIDGKKVPVFYLENERWGEFSKTWKFMDGDKNVSTPYITIRRVDKKQGTRMGDKYNVAQNKLFRYIDVPILDNSQVINLRFKMPQPVNVDLYYEISLFTKYREDVNYYDEMILKEFSSRQSYTTISKNFIPVLLDEISEPKTIENIDGDKFYISKYKFQLLGFIQNENDFKIVKTTRLPRFNISVDNSKPILNKYFDILLETIGEGVITTIPSDINSVPEGINITLTATPNIGSRFSKWVVNGYDKLTSTITEKITSSFKFIAEFIKQWTLTIEQPSNGTITTNVPAGLVDENTEVIANLVVDDGYGGTLVLDNVDTGETNLTFLMNANKALGAIVNAILTEILNVFSTAPVNNEFVDLTGISGNLPLVNLQSACFPAVNPVDTGVASIDFTGVSSVIYKTKFIWNTSTTFYPISFDGYSAAAKGFSARFTNNMGTLTLRLSNGTSNVTLTFGTSTWGMTNGDKCNLEINFNLNGASTATVNGVLKNTQNVTIAGSFLTPSSRLLNYGVADSDVHIIYSELVGYFKFHYKEGFGNTVYDVSGNGRNLSRTDTDNINWNSFYGDYAAEYDLGFTINEGVIVLGIESGLTDAQGNPIQYPSGSGFVDGLSAKVRIQVNEDLNEYIPSGDYSWAEIDALVESENIIKTKTGSQITSLIVKKKLSNNKFPYKLPFKLS